MRRRTAPRRGYHHGALKETLIARAFQDLEARGLEAVSLRGLADAAGVSKTAPYRHFRDKRDLLVTLAAEGFRLLAEALEGVTPQAFDSTEPLAVIRAQFRAYVEFARRRPALYRLMFSRLGFELHSEACRINSERALSCLARAVGAAQAAGWRQRHEATGLVMSLWASVHGWALLLIDRLAPPGIPLEGDEWMRAVDVLLE